MQLQFYILKYNVTCKIMCIYMFLSTELRQQLLDRQHELAKVEAELEKLQPFKVKFCKLFYVY